MSRRSTPHRIDEARHAATRAWLIGDGLTPDIADAWLAAWAEQAARDGVQPGAGDWDAGWAWIADQRAGRVRP